MFITDIVIIASIIIIADLVIVVHLIIVLITLVIFQFLGNDWEVYLLLMICSHLALLPFENPSSCWYCCCYEVARLIVDDRRIVVSTRQHGHIAPNTYMNVLIGHWCQKQLESTVRICYMRHNNWFAPSHPSSTPQAHSNQASQDVNFARYQQTTKASPTMMCPSRQIYHRSCSSLVLSTSLLLSLSL